MEQEGAVRIFSRSMDTLKLRYLWVISDGDSGSHKSVNDAEPYGKGVKITKEECVNHAEKRLGGALRDAVKKQKLGGNGAGRITVSGSQSKTARLQSYYGKAIRSNINDVDAMSDAIWASLFHSVSTDDDPHHSFCPQGPESWCKWNKAKALGVPAPSHGPKTMKTFMNRDLAKKLVPIYQRCADPALLERMKVGILI